MLILILMMGKMYLNRWIGKNKPINLKINEQETNYNLCFSGCCSEAKKDNFLESIFGANYQKRMEPCDRVYFSKTVRFDKISPDLIPNEISNFFK